VVQASVGRWVFGDFSIDATDFERNGHEKHKKTRKKALKAHKQKIETQFDG
jgi:hypothetical protein